MSYLTYLANQLTYLANQLTDLPSQLIYLVSQLTYLFSEPYHLLTEPADRINESTDPLNGPGEILLTYLMSPLTDLSGVLPPTDPDAVTDAPGQPTPGPCEEGFTQHADSCYR